MWTWFLEHTVWILIITAVMIIVIPVLNNLAHRPLSIKRFDAHHKKIKKVYDSILWTVEILAVIIIALAFFALAVADDIGPSVITIDDIEAWMLEHGFIIFTIMLVGAIFWILLKKVLPAFVGRVMARPRVGESPEGMRRRAKTLEMVFLSLGRILIGLMVVFMVLSELNVSIGPILAGFGIAGIAVGFGAQYLIRDLIAGIFIIVENQYRVGDVARVADVSGLVEEITLRKTILRDLDGIVHHVPNGEIKIASNFSRHFARVNLDISVSYGTDLDFAIGVIDRVCKEMAAEEDWRKLMITTPRVARVNNLGSSGVDLKVVGDVKPLEQWNIMGQLRLRIKKEFDKVGIEIPFPHTKIYFGNQPSGPDKKDTPR